MMSWRSLRPHMRATLILGLPLVGSHVAQVAVGMTDTLMVGWYDVTDLAAIVLAGSLFFLIFLVGSGFGWAVMPLVATAQAEGDTQAARRATRMGLWLSMLYGAITLPLLIWSEPLLIAVGQEPEIAARAQSYLRIAGWGLFPALAVMVVKSYLAALEHAAVVFWATVLAAVANAGFNGVLIFGLFGAPELGLRGAAIASLLTYALTGLVFVIYIQRQVPGADLFRRLWRADGEVLARVFTLGWPIGATSLAEAGLFTASAVLVGWIGEVELAAHGIALQLASLTFVVHLGLSNAATVRTGKAWGQADQAAIRDGSVAVLILSLLFVLVTVVLFLTLPGLLIGAFVSLDEPLRPTIIAVGTVLLAMAALFQLADAMQVIALGLLRGLQDTRQPMILAAISYWVLGLPAALILGFATPLGAAGVWLGLAVGLAVAAVLLLVRFRRFAQAGQAA